MPSSRSYLRAHYSLRNRIITFISHRFDNFTYTVRHGLIRGMKRKGGLGFLPAFLTTKSEETPEMRFLSRLDVRDAVVYDIGAYQGILTLYFSRMARIVIAYEPSPPNYERLAENLRLNRVTNVIARNLAVGAETGEATISYDPLMAGGASADPEVSQQIRQTSRKTISVKTTVIRLDDDIGRAGLPPPQFIKLDIEGMELAALRGMDSTLTLHRPAILMEIHGVTAESKDANLAAIMDFLGQKGYGKILHIESGLPATRENISQVSVGHLYCTAEG